MISLGLGMIFGSATAGATAGVRIQDSGVASALVNTVQKVGGALGTALLTTLAAQTTTGLLSEGGGSMAGEVAAVAGHGRSFLVAAAIFLVMAVACGTVLPRVRRT